MKRSIVHVGAATFATMVIVLSSGASALAAPAPALPAAAPADIDASTGSSTGSLQGLPAIGRGFACLLKTLSGGTGQICTV
ncbi:hypothetical protein ABZ942_23855 [Nocardia sp. NPDC046473]|uniref:hypothetical protein n=1 Tax=Nocardia sp. NPDC046473 TaxID=3155733 RepID=UPI0033CC8B91